MDANHIIYELRRHAPFTAVGALTGVALVLVIVLAPVPSRVSAAAFWTLHPLHVLLSALVTSAIYCRHGGGGWWRVLVVGYIGSVGIATVSDSLIPFAGEWLLDLPRRGLHLGFIEKWWLINPLAAAGMAIGVAWPYTHVSHAGHVLLSTWASLFHVAMAAGTGLAWTAMGLIALFLFLAVWIPCCTSDIVFPLLFTRNGSQGAGESGSFLPEGRVQPCE
jgi:hypothetical protein